MFSSQHKLLLKLSHQDPVDVNGPWIEYFSTLSTDEEQVLFEDFKLPLFLKNHRPKLVCNTSSCGGMVWFGDLFDEETIVVWNPTTSEIKTLPPPHESKQTINAIVSGLGYDSILEDYKFIRIICPPSFESDGRFLLCHATRAELYSFNRDSWKEISNLTIPYMTSWHSVYIEGSHYWLAFFDNYDFIVSFDFANETFSTLPLPGFHYYSNRLIDVDGSLGVLCFSSGAIEHATSCHVELWVLNENLESLWTKVFDVSLNGNFITPLGFGDNCRLLFCEAMRATQLLVYDRITQEIKEVDYNYKVRFKKNIFSYVETTNPLPQAKHTTT